MGERWAFLILCSAYNGLAHFEEFRVELGIARNILTNRLGHLVERGVFERCPSEDDRRRVQYRLTDRGWDLLPAVIALRQWGERHFMEGASNPILVDLRDLRPVRPVRIQAEDGRILARHELGWSDTPASGSSAN